VEQRTPITADPYGATTVVSPMMFGEESKDQDRARWHEPGLVACVCDGVTSSPRAAQAAELVTSFVPVLFDGDVGGKLRTICDLLVAHRREFETAALALPDETPEPMRLMLQAVFRQKQSQSFQTTLVALRLRPGRLDVGVDILRCGDSAYLAFSGDGELLHSSLASPPEIGNYGRRTSASPGWRFGPGDQILVQLEGSLDHHKKAAVNAGVDERYLKNWLICTPVHGCQSESSGTPQSAPLVVGPQDRLLVPRYLYGRQLESQGQEYRCLDYSSAIRIVPTTPPIVRADGIEHLGSVTAVLPDHAGSGCYDHVEDRFPLGTHFVLCSDGFYSAFATTAELWAWLQENREVLAKIQEREPTLTELHHWLHEKGGDDDLSFVWMYPMSSFTSEVNHGLREQQE
jgi:hypothetical protein